MAKIPLRAYNREIESMIESGHLEESVGHCQHILKIHPKYLEAYRLMAKAYLEARRFSDAADLFQRVLLSVPDDFVSHLAMSLIRDEEKSLDAAIWHMERAFEQQPSNAALQGELKRLYGRRDGMEPLKIRLTRGALAQMYAKGDQYAQAIAEIRSVLAEDPDRSDLQVLLAKVYFKAGQKVEATEVCNTLLRKYPYNLDANRLLVDILPGTGRADSAQVYRQRVIQLDPYAAHASESLFDLDDVSENAITIERFEWDPDAAAAFAMPEAVEESESDWMSMPETEQPTAEAELPAAVLTDEADIPEFLKDAGWGPSSGEFQEGPVNFDDFDDSDDSESPLGELASADIPDWLQSMAPPADETPSATGDATPAAEDSGEADLDFLSDLGLPGESGNQAEAAPSKAEETPDWMSGLGESEQPAEEQPEGEPAPDWLAGLGDAEETMSPFAQTAEEPISGDSSEGGIPDWLGALGEDEPAAEQSLADDATVVGRPAAESTPDWSDFPADEIPAEEQPATEETSDWLQNLGQDEETPGETPAAEEALDWMNQLGEAEPAGEQQPVSEAQPAEEPETSEDVDWLAGLASDDAGVPVAASDEEQTMMDKSPESPPQPTPEQPKRAQPQPSASDDDTFEGELSALVSGPGVSADEQDDAFAWLEALAAKQGAKSEELLVKPEERRDDAPSWVGQVGGEGAPPAEFQPEPVAETPQPAAKSSEPDELAFSADEELSPLASGPGVSTDEQDDAFAWLENLAAKQGAKSEELLIKPEERRDDAPGWVGQVGDEGAPPAEAQPVEEPPAPQPEQAVSVEQTITPSEPVAEPPQPVAPVPVASEFATPGDEELSPLASGPGVSADEQDDAFAWLENLAAKQGAKSEELLVKPEERRDDAPSWVGEVHDEPAAQPTEEAPAEFIPEPPIEVEAEPMEGELSPLASGPGVAADEQDDAFSWLESLAAGQGAKSEELLTKPEERRDDAPGWVGEVQNRPTQTSPLVSGPGTTEKEQEDSLEWLESLAEKQGAKSEELITEPETRHEDAPDWLDKLGETEYAFEEEPEVEAAAPVGDMPEADSLIDHWFDGEETEPEFEHAGEQPLDEEQPAAIEKPVEPEPEVGAESEAAGEPEEPMAVDEGDDVTAWLQSLDAEDAVEATGVPDSEMESSVAAEEMPVSEEAPSWLDDLEKSDTASSEYDDELPDWLQNDSADNITPTPLEESAWLPEEEPEVETPADEMVAVEPSAPEMAVEEPKVETPVPAPVAEQPPAPETPPPPTRPSPATYMAGDKDAEMLMGAQNQLQGGELLGALAEYGKLIKKGKMLDEVIYDLREATYRHPVDINVWQTLGDAYMRANRLQDALDSYTKAEELLR